MVQDESLVRESVAALVRQHGVAETCRKLGLHSDVVLRLTAGTPVRRGTVLAAGQALGLAGEITYR